MYNYDYKQLRFALYVRKSQEDKNRQVQSIESQLEVLEEHAGKENINIIKIYKDCASAHKPNNRKGFNEMLQDINDKKIDSILCWKADRLARNHIEGGMTMHCLEQGIIKMIKTPHKTFLPTDNTLPLTIEFGMANQYSRDLSLNIKRGNKTKVNKGGWCHIAPQGYVNNRLEKKIETDPERFSTVRKMWDLALTGQYSLQQICEKANNEWNFKTSKKKNTGGVKLTTGTLHNILVNPFYYGYIKAGEHQAWGNHKPMITFKEFEKVQSILRYRGRKAYTSQSFAYSGIMKCKVCSSMITAETKVKYKCPKCGKKQTAKNPKICSCGYMISHKDISKGKFYTYYHCSKSKGECNQKSIRKELLDKQFESFITSLEIRANFIDWAEKWLKYLEQREVQKEKKDKQTRIRQIKDLESQLSRLVDMRMTDEIGADLFKKKKEVLEKQMIILKGKNHCRNTKIQEIREALSFIENLKTKFLNASNKEKKQLILEIGSNPTLRDKKLLVQAKRKYLTIQKLRVHKNNKIEPPKDYSTSRLQGNLRSCYQTWCTILDENETF
ncbi:hypothetical protein EZY14_007380 [Kordia sp. TARA_039_SRF]|nr:hypothetical protein EZY14_007380 [Kordia sp. TARA_039_SRF]